MNFSLARPVFSVGLRGGNGGLAGHGLVFGQFGLLDGPSDDARGALETAASLAASQALNGSSATLGEDALHRTLIKYD